MRLNRSIFSILLGLGACGLLAFARAPGKAGSKPRKVVYETDVKPLFTRYCYGCHGEKMKGGLDLRIYQEEASAKKDAETFGKVLDYLQTGDMPPDDKPQPTSAERKRIIGWIQAQVLDCDCDHPDPGRVTIRRLNRAEYNNTIRDLVGVKFQPADDFPSDDIGYGFDNIGDVLSLSPMLMEKYFSAAGKIMDAAIPTGTETNGPVKHFPAKRLGHTEGADDYGSQAKILRSESEVYASFNFPKTGKYILRARAYGQQAGPEPARMQFRVDGSSIAEVKVTAVESRPDIYEIPLDATPGMKRVGLAFVNDYYHPEDPDPNNRDRNLVVENLDIMGPVPTEPPPPPEARKRIFVREPMPDTTNAAAREIIADFTRRAWRRPVAEEEIDRLLQIFQMVEKDGGGFDSGIKLALEAVLVSPNFLFRGELQPEPDNPQSVHPVDDYALASRLSYFLWSSMPDDELFALAAKGKLRENLGREVKRMLKDPKASALVKNFGDQWLQIRNLATAAPDKETYPDFDEDLRSAMERETELYLEYVIQQDRSILEFVDSDYTFLNERLARHYGVSGVTGSEFRRVSLKGNQRGGLLTQASILTVTSTPTRTSPVKRGKWVLENILGTPPPPPLPGVPELKEGKEVALTGTLRQRMEQHRADPACANCHAKMDPIGFGFENFNGIGEWRTNEDGFALDTTGQLVTGESFKGVADLKTILLKHKREQFVHCLSEKMLTYALGRGLERYDKCAVDEIAKKLEKNHYRFSSLIMGVTESAPFQLRRGEEKKMEQEQPAVPAIVPGL